MKKALKWIIVLVIVPCVHVFAAGVHGELFASPKDALQALQTAVINEDQTALMKIFGPELNDLMTGDKVQDANNIKAFAVKLAQGVTFVQEHPGQITFKVGFDGWPMPIPLVPEGKKWYFDTAAGKEEIIDRHIGKDELYAISACHTYVKAQRQYALQNPLHVYAQKFKSSPGKKDGLYWSSEQGETSPLKTWVDQAYIQGYFHHKNQGRHPFYGYYFKILTRQGPAAPGGKMNYMRGGQLRRGFALIAYPANWDRSGVMSFIVNQDDKVYQCNLGENTEKIAVEMKEYNPDGRWEQVEDKM